MRTRWMVVALALGACSTPGRLVVQVDAGFGADGVARLDLGDDETAWDVAQQSGGRLIVVGSTPDASIVVGVVP